MIHGVQYASYQVEYELESRVKGPSIGVGMIEMSVLAISSYLGEFICTSYYTVPQ